MASWKETLYRTTVCKRMSLITHLLCYSRLEPALMKLLFVGGKSDAAMAKVEVVGFIGPGLTCEDIPDYPAADCCLFGTSFDGRVELCGGVIYDRRYSLNSVNMI